MAASNSNDYFATRRTRSRTPGFTLLELMVALILIVLLMALFLPAVQSARERARMAQCQNKLMQIGIGLANYNQTHQVLPPGCVNATGLVQLQESGYQIGWIVQILPFMNEHAAWAGVDFVDPWWSFEDPARKHATIAAFKAWQDEHPGEQPPEFIDLTDSTPLRRADGSLLNRVERKRTNPTTRFRGFDWLQCPSTPRLPALTVAQSNYAGCQNDADAPIDLNGNGLLFLNSSESLNCIPDGRSTTLLLGEKKDSIWDSGWFFGDRSTLRNGLLDDSPFDRPTSQGGKPTLDFSGMNEADRRKVLEQNLTRVGGFGSAHPFAVNFALADGSVRAISHKIAPEILRKLVNRHDGSLVSDREF